MKNIYVLPVHHKGHKNRKMFAAFTNIDISENVISQSKTIVYLYPIRSICILCVQKIYSLRFLEQLGSLFRFEQTHRITVHVISSPTVMTLTTIAVKSASSAEKSVWRMFFIPAAP